LHDLVDEAHLFDCIEGASNQALTASDASVFTDGVDHAQTTGNGTYRANLTARIATNAFVLVDLDDATQFATAKIANVFGSVFTASIGCRCKRIDLNRFGHI
jgi:hypothetical protein